MALPLFKFPILVIKIILETMGFIEMFVLSSTSSKTKRIFKNLVRIQNNRMRLFLKNGFFVFDFRSNLYPCLGTSVYLEPKENQPDDVFQLKIGSSDRVPSAFSRSKNEVIILTIYSNTSINNGTKLYDAFFEVFKIALMHIEMDLTGVAVEKYQSWINWKNDSFQDVFVLYIEGQCSFSGYIWILKNARTKHELILEVEPTEYPKDPESIEILNVEVPNILIHHASWISMKQLGSIRASSITIGQISLTDSQINTFLRNWRSLEIASYSKQLRICFNCEANVLVVLEGLEVTNEDMMKSEDTLNQWSFMMANGEKCTVIYCEYESDVPEFGFEFHVGN